MGIVSKTKNITDIVLNKHNFALVYISFLLLRSVFFLQVYVDAICKLCLFWGALIVICDLFKYKLNFFKTANSFLPLLLCVSYVVSVALNFDYSLCGKRGYMRRGHTRKIANERIVCRTDILKVL